MTIVEKMWVVVETGAMAFGGAAFMCVEKAIETGGLPSTSAQWNQIAAGAIAAGAIALFQRFRTVPGTVSVPVDTGKPVPVVNDNGSS
jgi:hypothetical protein